MKRSIELVPLTEPAPPALESMTFPIYRPLLTLEPANRHPEQGDERRIRPIVVVARWGEEALGLALGEVPLDGGEPPEMLSLFVRAELRGQGLGTALVAALEREVAALGFERLTAVWTRGKPAIAALEQVLWKQGWVAPRPRTISVRFPPAAALASDLFSERRMKALSARLKLFPWRDLGDREKAEIRSSHEAEPWITPALAPWRFDGAGFDPVSSIGARYRGEVVGWVLNHVVAPGTVRFTCSFMRKDISRRGRIIPLYGASLERLAEAGVARATFVTPVIYPNMVRFIQRWIAPIAEFVGETRGSSKTLAAAGETTTAP